MADQRAKLTARKAELEAKINEASGWGASVGVMYEELRGVNRALGALPATDTSKSEDTPAAAVEMPTKPVKEKRVKHDKSVEQHADAHPLIPPEEVSAE